MIQYFNKQTPMLSIRLIGIIILFFSPVVFSLACNKPTEPQPAWDWIKLPTIRFTTTDWRFAKQVFSAGDTIGIGFYDCRRGNQAQIAELISASGDTEHVNIFKYQLDIWTIPDYFGVGAHFPSNASNQITVHNGILEIIDPVEHIQIIYRHPIPPPPTGYILVLTDSAKVKK